MKPDLCVSIQIQSLLLMFLIDNHIEIDGNRQFDNQLAFIIISRMVSLYAHKCQFGSSISSLFSTTWIHYYCNIIMTPFKYLHKLYDIWGQRSIYIFCKMSDSSMPRFNIVYSLPRINITIVCPKIMQNDCLSAVEVT